jgi:ATP-dependent DNA helicase RecQ
VEPSPTAIDDGTSDLARVLEIVRATFGFETLRPLQARAIQATLAGKDLLLVMPTGGGKSLCYQAPAIARDGLTVVVSPLISLMQDQVDSLRADGVEAGMLASGQDPSDRAEVHRGLESGRLKLLYVAPERLLSEGFLARLLELEGPAGKGLRGIAIDEAHCISHWGHDFRPEYRALGELRRRFPSIPIQAYTATATPRVREDVARALGLRDAEVLVGSFDRPNLTYRVLPRRELARDVAAVIRRHAGEAGIVYCLRRSDVEDLCAKLSDLGIRCEPYHAGLEPARRTATQRAFQREELDVVVATVAFGMGIDRPDVRFVVHASLPKGVEQYSQETGRAGRDGLPSECVLFYGGADFHGWKSLIEHSAREAAAAGLENAGADTDDALERLSHMWNLATGAICRHRSLCEYFGETSTAEGPGPEPACGACDVCLGEIARLPEAVVVAQKILSCVVKTGQRFGAAHVTDVLRGAQTEKIRQTGHDLQSTYGLLASESARDIRAWIEQLVGQGHLRLADGPYPTLFLSKSGVEVLRGERGAVLLAPAKPASGGRSGRRGAAAVALAALEGEPAPDLELFERLRELRRALARERGVPPYVIFNDKTLLSMAGRKPRTAEELRAIKGVGDKKAADLGPAFLEAIAAPAEA